ncbi:hypothetical protein L210DRAFT_3525623 [Boletus edulis BED1]|uniref:Uncharacterized protein n=1 Tax=Boletus edulis BED1 TaxID=1328754 RepID=A0AAD4C3C3_BOLED|nr:hypothetical protein L210DRAFT_3525623 [Boletus edulis BED1]
MNVSAYSTYGYVELATSKGLRVSHDLIPSTSRLPHGVQNASLTLSGMESMMDAEHNSMHAFGTEPSTSVFRSTPNADPKRIHKIDKIKQKLVDMLREIGFKLSNGRLPWSTLEGDLSKKGYTILNWPHGVVRDRDKGISGLSAEDTDRLHDALFVDEQHIQFIPCGEGKIMTIYDSTIQKPASNSDGATSLVVALGTDRPRDSGRSTTGKQQRFKVTTAAAFIEHPRPRKRRRT